MAQGPVSRSPGRSCDVVVVGGGPAGTAAAVTCASAGLDVVLVEAVDAGGPPKPGETLHPGAEPVLRALGVLDPLVRAGPLRHTGHWVEWRGPVRFEPFGADDDGVWRGYQVMRDVLDELLLARAREAGATVLRPCRALVPIVDDDRVHGVVTTRGEVEASVVIDATGGRHWLARQLGVPLVRWSPPLVAWYGHRTGSCPRHDRAPVLRADADGWTWIARVRSDTYAWVRLVVDPRDAQVQVPPELSGLPPLGHRRRGADVTWRIAAAPVAPGYLLAGDAYAVLDPAASHGILRALISGTLAAQVATEAVLHGADVDDVGRTYSARVSRWFQRDAAGLASMYQGFPAWPAALAGTVGARSVRRRRSPGSAPDTTRRAADDRAPAVVPVLQGHR